MTTRGASLAIGFVLCLVGLNGGPANCQEDEPKRAVERKKEAYVLPKPKGWAFEQIKLPPPFAPSMKLKGLEDIRFAPGMFKPDSESFFSYAVLFWLDGGSKLDEAALKRELAVYYQGLSERVLKGANADVEARKIEVRLKAQKKGTSKSSHEIDRYRGSLVWTEPFQTRREQTLHFDLDVWRCEPSRRVSVFLTVSPRADRNAPIWKQLGEIREGFRCHGEGAAGKDQRRKGE